MGEGHLGRHFGDLPDLTIAPDMRKLAEHLLDSKAGDFEPTAFRDRYEEALLAHLKAATVWGRRARFRRQCAE